MNPNITISSPNTTEDENATTSINIITNALHAIFINFLNKSITLSGSVVNLFINSPTPISSNAIAGKS